MQSQRPTTVYIVEDSAPLRARIIEMLEQVSRPRIVGEAEAALEAIVGIRATRPDAVVLDLNLRQSSGLDVLRAFSRDLDAPLFIVVTNQPSEQHRRECLAAGADYFLDKSLEFLRINDIVGSLSARAA